MEELEPSLADFGVILDACVLYPASLRDILLESAVVRLYRPLWTEDILEELRRTLLTTNRATLETAQKLVEDMKHAFPAALVTAHTPLIAAMTNHPDDRHVLAAAVVAGAQVIVTSNLKDFPETALAPYQVEAQHPDVFLTHLYDLEPAGVETALERHIQKLHKPPKTREEVLRTLAQHVPGFVTLLRGGSYS